MQRYRGILVVGENVSRRMPFVRAASRHTRTETIRSLADLGGDVDPIHGSDVWAGIVLVSESGDEAALASALVPAGCTLAIEIEALTRPLGDRWRLFLGRALAYAVTRSPSIASCVRAYGHAYDLSAKQMEILAASVFPNGARPWELLGFDGQRTYDKARRRVAEKCGATSIDDAARQLLLDALVLRGEHARPGFYRRMRGAQ